MEEQPEAFTKNGHAHKRTPAVLITALLALATIAAAVVGYIAWHSKQAPSITLPSSIASQVQGFTPYYYTNPLPAGYSLDASKATFDQGVLIMPLTKHGGHTVVLAEQPSPSSVSQQDLQQGTSKVAAAAGPATINTVEGRLLGTMIATSTQGRTLVLLNASGETDKADLVALLQGLRAVRNEP